jgi:hypothetical protein
VGRLFITFIIFHYWVGSGDYHGCGVALAP